jgi:hypothetical protein
MQLMMAVSVAFVFSVFISNPDTTRYVSDTLGFWGVFEEFFSHHKCGIFFAKSSSRE